jgi:lysylphosphatidylglycerol synthetase-like protein (DUF2156 family)
LNSFERYLSELGASFTGFDFLVFFANLFYTAVLCFLLGVFYSAMGSAGTDRKRFAKNFAPLGMTTMVIIFVVKSSVALSLGLVGALSIVRFRAAIREPEELVYLFLTICLGLAAGAGHIVVAFAAFGFIILMLTVQYFLTKNKRTVQQGKMSLLLRTSSKEMSKISGIVNTNFLFVELRRMDESPDGLELGFVVEAGDLSAIEITKNELRKDFPDITISLLEQKITAG